MNRFWNGSTPNPGEFCLVRLLIPATCTRDQREALLPVWHLSQNSAQSCSRTEPIQAANLKLLLLSVPPLRPQLTLPVHTTSHGGWGSVRAWLPHPQGVDCLGPLRLSLLPASKTPSRTTRHVRYMSLRYKELPHLTSILSKNIEPESKGVFRSNRKACRKYGGWRNKVSGNTKKQVRKIPKVGHSAGPLTVYSTSQRYRKRGGRAVLA